jgi:hypothetical protein
MDRIYVGAIVIWCNGGAQEPELTPRRAAAPVERTRLDRVTDLRRQIETKRAALAEHQRRVADVMEKERDSTMATSAAHGMMAMEKRRRAGEDIWAHDTPTKEPATGASTFRAAGTMSLSPRRPGSAGSSYSVVSSLMPAFLSPARPPPRSRIVDEVSQAMTTDLAFDRFEAKVRAEKDAAAAKEHELRLRAKRTELAHQRSVKAHRDAQISQRHTLRAQAAEKKRRDDEERHHRMVVADSDPARAYPAKRDVDGAAIRMQRTELYKALQLQVKSKAKRSKERRMDEVEQERCFLDCASEQLEVSVDLHVRRSCSFCSHASPANTKGSGPRQGGYQEGVAECVGSAAARESAAKGGATDGGVGVTI